MNNRRLGIVVMIMGRKSPLMMLLIESYVAELFCEKDSPGYTVPWYFYTYVAQWSLPKMWSYGRASFKCSSQNKMYSETGQQKSLAWQRGLGNKIWWRTSLWSYRQCYDFEFSLGRKWKICWYQRYIKISHCDFPRLCIQARNLILNINALNA